MITQQWINEAIDHYNRVTKAHKRAPVEDYITKKLQEGKEVEMLAGSPRWTSGIVFYGTPNQPQVRFEVNKSVPKSFQPKLQEMKEQFEKLRTTSQPLDDNSKGYDQNE